MNNDFCVTWENHWQITSLVTQKSLFTVTHACIILYILSNLYTRHTNEYVVGAAGNAPTTSKWSTIVLPCLLRCALYYRFNNSNQNIYKWMQIVHSYCYSNHASGLTHVILIISLVFDLWPAGLAFNKSPNRKGLGKGYKGLETFDVSSPILCCFSGPLWQNFQISREWDLKSQQPSANPGSVYHKL